MQSARYRALDTSGLNHSSMEYAKVLVLTVSIHGHFLYFPLKVVYMTAMQ